MFWEGKYSSHGDTGNRHSTTTVVEDKEGFLEEVTSTLRPEESVGGGWVKKRQSFQTEGSICLGKRECGIFKKHPVKWVN